AGDALSDFFRFGGCKSGMNESGATLRFTPGGNQPCSGLHLSQIFGPKIPDSLNIVRFNAFKIIGETALLRDMAWAASYVIGIDLQGFLSQCFPGTAIQQYVMKGGNGSVKPGFEANDSIA